MWGNRGIAPFFLIKSRNFKSFRAALASLSRMLNKNMEESYGRNRLKKLEQVIVEFQDQLFRFAFFRTGSLPDAQDIVQDVFIKLYNETAYLDKVDNLKGYLYRSISNACIDYSRRKSRRRFDTLESIPKKQEVGENTTSDNLMLMEEYSRIEMLLDGLPEEQSEIVRLRVFDGLSFVEIAQLQEIPVTTVKSRFKYGIDKLKSKIEKVKEVNHGL